MLWEGDVLVADVLVVDVSVASLLDELFVALLLVASFGELLLDASFGELSEEVEVEAWLVEGWDGWFDGLVAVEVVWWELVPSVGMALSLLASHLPQSSGWRKDDDDLLSLSFY